MLAIALLAPSPDANPVMPGRVACCGGKLAYPEDDRTIARHPGRRRRGRPRNPVHRRRRHHADHRTRRPVDQGHRGREIATPEVPHGMDGPSAHVRDELRCVEAREEPRSRIA